MLTKTRIALAIALIAGSASVAAAQGFDPNPANRYPTYATPTGAAPYLGVVPAGSARRAIAVAPRTLQTAPVGLYQGRAAAPTAQYQSYVAGQQDEVGVDLRDRASSPYAGGVN